MESRMKRLLAQSDAPLSREDAERAVGAFNAAYPEIAEMWVEVKKGYPFCTSQLRLTIDLSTK